MRKLFANPVSVEVNFEKWPCDIVDPIIKDVESLIPDELTDDQKAVKLYWNAFAQNTINLSRMMSNLPHHFAQVIMAFRLLQETSADIFYLKNNTKNIEKLVETEKEVKGLIVSSDFTLRRMSQIIARTDIRNQNDAKCNKCGTQKRIDTASKFLEENLGEGMTKNLRDINNLLNGYSHFNPAGTYLQKSLTDKGYFEVYMKVLYFYPAWLYLVLVSLHELLGIEKLNKLECEKIVDNLLTKIQESDKWLVEFVSKYEEI